MDSEQLFVLGLLATSIIFACLAPYCHCDQTRLILIDDAFRRIAGAQRAFLLFLHDPERRGLRRGDRVLVSSEDTGEIISRRVVGVQYPDTEKEFFERYGARAHLGGGTARDGSPIYCQNYTGDEERRFGLVAYELAS